MVENIIYNKKLRKIRRVKDLTQEYIAFELGISQKAYSDIEQGKTKMREDLLLKKIKHLSECCSVCLKSDLTVQPESWISSVMQG